MLTAGTGNRLTQDQQRLPRAWQVPRSLEVPEWGPRGLAGGGVHKLGMGIVTESTSGGGIEDMCGPPPSEDSLARLCSFLNLVQNQPSLHSHALCLSL